MSTLVSRVGGPLEGGLPTGELPTGELPSKRGRRSSMRTWRWSDRLVWLAAWVAGLSLCAIAAAILLYMGYRGVQYLRPSLIFSRPQPSTDQAGSGGFLDPLLGTALLTVIGIAIAAPLAICSALWIVEYGQGGRARQAMARVVESSIEIVAGTPDILIAVFGLAIFQLHLFAFASTVSKETGAVYGQSFLAAGAMMSLIALPPLFVATRDGLQSIPAHMREAAFALGKTRIATIRRVLLPSVRPNIATGVTLGVSRIIADTAIVIVLLGDELRISPNQGGLPGLNVLRGIGSSLTSYVYDNSPAGEAGAPQKAYAAAVLLLLFVVLLNLAVERFARANARSGGFAAAGGIV
jgi:phosphate transport system permease protein